MLLDEREQWQEQSSTPRVEHGEGQLAVRRAGEDRPMGAGHLERDVRPGVPDPDDQDRPVGEL